MQKQNISVADLEKSKLAVIITGMKCSLEVHTVYSHLAHIIQHYNSQEVNGLVMTAL